MKIYDIEPNEDAPAGYEKLADLRDRLGSESCLRGLQLGTILAFEFNSEDGSTPQVQQDDWRSEYWEQMLEFGRKWHYFSPAAPDDPANARDVFFYGSAGRLLLVKANNVSIDELANKGGRPPKNWDRMWRKVVSIANSPDGLPDDRAELVRVLQNWMAETGQEVAGDTTLKNKLRAVYERKDEP